MDSPAVASASEARQIADARLRAKERLQQREQSSRLVAATQPNSNHKRPLQVISADSTSPTAPNTRTISDKTRTLPVPSSSKALQAAIAGQAPGTKHFQGVDKNAPLKNMIGNYVEYDLSTLKNSKGGFLLENEDDDPKRRRERELAEELKMKRLENARKQGQLREPRMALNPADNPKCVHCGSLELDSQMRQIFGVFVCGKDKAERPELYSLLTKTECKEDYLLTESELRDEELMPHLLRPNPHRPTFSNMMLFLRSQVEEFAFSPKKWGSPEALDQEFQRREAEKAEKKGKKFAREMKELRKKTKTNVWHKRVEGEHAHTFSDVIQPDGAVHQVCDDCGFAVEVETF